MRAAGACSAASGRFMQRTTPPCTTMRPLGAIFQPQQCARRFLGGFDNDIQQPVAAVPHVPWLPSRPPLRPWTPAAAASEVAEVEGTETANTDQGHSRTTLFAEDYKQEYHNFVALTGSLMYKTWKNDKLTFTLFVKWQGAPEQPGERHTYHQFYVEVDGDLAREVNEKVTDDLIIAVNGKLKPRVGFGNSSCMIVANDVGIISNAPDDTAAPREIVEAVEKQAAAAQQQATAAQPPPPPPAAARSAKPSPASARKTIAAATGGGGSGGLPQQKPAAAAAAGGAVAAPGIPDHPADDREAQWMELFKNPKGFFDNRTTKTNPKAPDFVQKRPGTTALWVEDRRTPQWVFENLQLLPGNVPYTGTFKPSGGGWSSSGSGSSAGAKQLDFLPAEARNEKEAQWIDVFQNYKNYWDNRLNKLNPKAPDFKSKDNTIGTALWITGYDTPDWVKQNIETLPRPPPPKQ